jgi:hypothetical protein
MPVLTAMGSVPVFATQDIFTDLIAAYETLQSEASELQIESQEVRYPCASPPASAEAIEQLPRLRVLPVHHDQCKYKVCSVCYDSLINEVILTKLPCGHVYHLRCIFSWLNIACFCPECRYEMPTSSPTYEKVRIEKMRSYKLHKCKCKNVHDCFFTQPSQIDETGS